MNLSRLISHSHLRSISAVRHPLGTSHRRGLLQHSVDLLEGKTLGFWDQEIGVDEAECAERSPQEEDLWSEINTAACSGSDVWGDDGDDAVPQPVGSGGKSNTTRSDWEREDFTDDNPGTWSPSCSEEEDVNADEGDHCRDGWLGRVGDTDNGDDELANKHTKSTPDHDGTTTVLLNDVEGDGCRADVDQGGDQADQERVVDGVELGEEGGTEIEDEVDSSPLLHHLQARSQDGSAKVASWVS